MKRYRSTKTWGTEVGLSACFRQWRADSHCKLLHGYALGVRMVFEADKLDERNWVVDFGGFKHFKRWLESQFDHKLLIAEDDPEMAMFQKLAGRGLCELVVLPNVGCEAFAEHIFQQAKASFGTARVTLISVEVFEHGANSAIALED